MKKSKSNIVKTLLLSVLLLLLLLWPLTGLAAEAINQESVYIITETELATLEQNSNRLLEISKQLTTELETARQQLKISEQASTEAKLQKELLQKQLTELEAWSKKQEELQQKILKSLPPSAPGVLREIGAKIDIDHYVTGISYGVSRRIGSKYIGFRGEYDWQDKKTGVWVTYAY
ncbi:hypothetical protein [Phascolarctobacterium faecium]